MSGVDESIELRLAVSDRETVAELSRFADEAERAEYALAALRVGVLAMRQVRGELDAQTIRAEGDAILSRIEQTLGAHEKTVQEKMAMTLASYFDPASGQFTQRVKSLTENGGELERVILAQLSGDSSALGQTLAQAVGAASPVMQALDPAAKNGIVERLSTAVDELNAENRKQIVGQFDLNNPNSALSQFILRAQQQNQTVEQALRTKVDELAKMLSLDVSDSAMSRVRQTLLQTLKTAEDANTQFRQDVLLALQELKVRKEEAAKSTTHGFDFEDAVAQAAIDFASQHNDVAAKTGATTGAIKSCKIGDVVITLGPECTATGANIVIEAKESGSYDLHRALEEMDTALKNRQATAGVFVSSTLTSSPTIPVLRRYGNIVVVKWHPEEPSTQPYLEAAMSISRFIATARNASAGGQVDVDELEACVRAIEKKAGKLDDIVRSAETIKGSAKRIVDAAEILRGELGAQVAKLDAWEKECRAGLA